MEHLTLPVLNESQTQEISKETLEVERLDNGAWRLLRSPAFVWGIARGDVIRYAPSELSAFVIVQRSGLLAVVVTMPSGEEERLRRVLEPEVSEAGGSCDGGPPRTMVFSIPVSLGFSRVEAIFDQACARIPGSEWWFGNVYGPNDVPLNWWKK